MKTRSPAAFLRRNGAAAPITAEYRRFQKDEPPESGPQL